MDNPKGQIGVGCFGYPQTKVDQTPRFDKKFKKRKKKKDKHEK